MHPDKSDSPTAEEEYRVVVAVGEVLRDGERRQAYDAVLRDGLPDWRHPVYYFRATAKMSVPGVLALLAVAATVVQAAGLWVCSGPPRCPRRRGRVMGGAAWQVGYFDRRAQARAAAARRTKRIKASAPVDPLGPAAAHRACCRARALRPARRPSCACHRRPGVT